MTSQSVVEQEADYRPDEVVVALPHEGSVLAVLHEARGGDLHVDRDELLGLARISFDAQATVQGLSSLDDWERASEAREARLPRREDPSELDQALSGLRAVLAHRWSGWTPTMGKNRLVASVEGGGRISGGMVGRISGGMVGRISGGGTAPVAATRRARLPQGTRPGQGVRVGVLDTGLSPHSRLAGCYARYSDLLSPEEDAEPRAGHATFIAGLVLSQAPGATVEVRRALESDATGDSWSAARKIVQFGRDGVDVLNLSFLCFTEDDEPPMALAAAIDRLDPAIVVVAAAGNHGAMEDIAQARPAWPAALDDVVAVGAVDAAGRHASFSPPENLPWIDVRAQGVDLVSTYLDEVELGGSQQFRGFAQWSGTSFAAALVSGAIAAATDPGRVPARAAWDDMRSALAGPTHPERTADAARAPLQPVMRLVVP
ncbi:MAG: hypothetical protein AVDCRST_MAG07-152 [uncultured Frankineae bacterium]|uniref:Peptidase S8/S53 domain-containing protein n=1 Tax=uncultured Frankineae bacterium TaxID=437475 RepID=A0A6J4KIC9_9ACTN|nr:MAG: hypothetical protein AVDCRST_MAG07-152 [uncultured Frankineae bacterium]